MSLNINRLFIYMCIYVVDAKN